MGIQSRLDEKGHLIISNVPDSKLGKLTYQNYMFDYLTIMSNLTFLITHQPILVRSILRHKDGKTFKFIIRNLYFLSAMAIVDSSVKGQLQTVGVKDYTIWFDHSNLTRYKMDIAKEFFKRSMFDNPHLTSFERRAKMDARIIF